MQTLRTIGLSALALALSATMARADDADVLRGKLKAASAATTSFVIQMHMSGPTSIDQSATVVSPQTMRSEMVVGTMKLTSYVVDGIVYLHFMPADTWRKMRLDNVPASFTDVVSAAETSKLTVLADRAEDGATVGAFQIDVQNAAAMGSGPVPPIAGPLVCSYDKTTYRLRTCTNPAIVMHFGKYNDPANVVVLPPEAAGAVLVIQKTPAPGAMPTAAPGAASPTPAPGAALPAASPPLAQPSSRP